MVWQLARRLIFAAWVVLLLGAVGCATKQVSSPPNPPAPQTHEQGEPSDEQAGDTGSEDGSGSSKGSEGGGQGTSGSTVSRPSDSAMTPEEQRSEGDRKLDESLAEFDDRLRRERERSEEASNDGTGSGSESSSHEGATGGESDNRDAGAPAVGRTTDESRARSGDPPNLPDGGDDDIVAQQLRELAENERDPEKRAIYWQDYLDYKSGERNKSGRQEEGRKDDNDPGR